MSRDTRPPPEGGSEAPGPQDRRSEFLRERGLRDDPAFYGADAERDEAAPDDPAPDGDGPETEDEPRR
jgi:hypothetical protein